MIIDREKINEVKDKLGFKNAELLQEIYKMDKWDERRGVGCCPNPHHDDHNPSCSYDHKLHRLKCFSCGWSSDLIQAQMNVNGMTFIDACAWLFEQAGERFEYADKGKRTHGRDYNYPEPKYADNKDKVYAYWANRGISKETIDYLGIQQDPDGHTMFEYYDLNDVLVDVKVRRHDEPPKGKSKCWHLTTGPKANVLYNINKIVPDQPLIITSGEGDAATAVECGFTNTVSINGGDGNTQWITECWDWLEQFAEIILVHDNDESGRKFEKEVSKRLGEFRVKNVDIPEEPLTDYTSGEVLLDKNGEVRYINDLNDLLISGGKEAVIEAINNAHEAEIPSVIDYTNVKKFDMSEVDGFTTGIHALDLALDKFYMGSTTILTGAPGSGKTSFLSTLICQALNQGYKTFVYSGELSNPSLKNWIDSVHAGRWGLLELKNQQTGATYYKIAQETFQKINENYKDMLWFYRDDMSQKVSDLLRTAENLVRRSGVKFLVFDNMSSVDLEANDDNKWNKQEDFIRDIISFSRKWNVCCAVVLHPKKVGSSRITSLYDLSGVTASVNLSHRVLSLYRVSQKEKDGKIQKGQPRNKEESWIHVPNRFDVLVDVLKDRFGSGLGHTAGLFYDIPSKRFYDSDETLFFQYKWDQEQHTGEAPGGKSTMQKILEEEEVIFGPPLPQ